MLSSFDRLRFVSHFLSRSLASLYCSLLDGVSSPSIFNYLVHHYGELSRINCEIYSTVEAAVFRSHLQDDDRGIGVVVN